MISKSLAAGGLQWRTARRSVGNGACVEVAPAAGIILVRDSMDRDGVAIQYPGTSWRGFIGAAKNGQYDLDHL